MAAELGVISAVIAVADATLKSCKALHDLIDGLRDAPDELSYLRADINEVGRALKSFADLERRTGIHENAQYHTTLQHTLEQLRPSMQELGSACDAFRIKLDKTFRHSAGNKMSNRDRFRFQWQESEIKRFKSRLSAFKDTVTLALGLASLSAISSNAHDISKLDQLTRNTSNSLLIQVNDVNQQMKAIAAAAGTTKCKENFTVNSTRDTDLQNLQIQKHQLEDHLKVCASMAKGIKVKYAEVTDDAKQFVGNIGNVESGSSNVEVESAIAKSRARQVIGNMDGASALEFLK